MGISSTIISIVTGVVVVIIAFALWPVLNGSSDQLYDFFQDSCRDESNSHFSHIYEGCLLYTSPSPRDRTRSRMPSSA